MSSRRSWRTVRRRNRFGQAKARSTARRGAGIDALAGGPDVDAAITRHPSATRNVVGLAAVQRGGPLASPSGRLSDRRDGVDEPGELNRIVAAVGRTASGVPPRPTTRWRLMPGLPRSAGSGPVWRPPFLPGCRHCPGRRGSGRCGPPRQGDPAACGGDDPGRPPPASPASAAGRSSPTRSRAPAAASPRECSSRARRRCRSNGRDRATTVVGSINRQEPRHKRLRGPEGSAAGPSSTPPPRPQARQDGADTQGPLGRPPALLHPKVPRLDRGVSRHRVETGRSRANPVRQDALPRQTGKGEPKRDGTMDAKHPPLLFPPALRRTRAPY